MKTPPAARRSETGVEPEIEPGIEPGIERRPAAADGDRWFVTAYPSLRRFAAFAAPPSIDPDDLVQEAMTRLIQQGTLTGLDNPVAYVRRTMLNIVRNEHRRVGREAAALRRLERPSPPDGSVEPRTGHDLSVLEQLTATSRTLVFLVDVENYAIADAAAFVGVSSVAARARLSRARRALKEHLSKESDR